MKSLAFLFGFGCILSLLAVRIGIPIAHKVGVVDQPGGHKQHDRSTPFVGGVGVFAALVGTLSVSGYLSASSTIQWQAMVFGTMIMFVTGLIDDIRHLSFRLRFVVQAVVALVMALLGGVVLADLGQLAFGQTLRLGFLAVPFTVLATIGVINALNMIDGIDGLSGSISMISLLLIAMVSAFGGVWDYTILAVGMLGGVVGFLYYNLRHSSHRRARVFLGDNGSMLLGFLFAWLFIDLSQEPGRVITPVAALWLFSIPLMDTMGVMLRRVWLGKSPFHPDRHHLHHLFLRAGFRVQDTVYAIALIHLSIGTAGIVGMQLGIPESFMLLAFLLLFTAYFYLIVRPWRFVPVLRRLHTLLGLTSPGTRGVFLGNCALDGVHELVAGLSEELGARDDYRLHIYKTSREGREDRYAYAVVEILTEDSEASVEEIRQLVEVFKRRFKGRNKIRVRQFLVRDSSNDRRVGKKHISQDFRSSERRSKHNKVLIHSAHGTSHSVEAMA